jgi:hypothetical protein
MTSTETQISELHRWFCERTGLQTKLCFAQRLWFEMLRSYMINSDEEGPISIELAAVRLRADADLIIRYLKREIGRDKRNLGALKLINFLQPDNFDADLAIARMAIKKTGLRKPDTGKENGNVDAPGIPDDDPLRKETVGKLRALRQSLRGGA